MIAEALAQLADDQREVILLRNLERMSARDVGDRIGRSSASVRELWGSALSRLQSLFHANGGISAELRADANHPGDNDLTEAATYELDAFVDKLNSGKADQDSILKRSPQLANVVHCLVALERLAPAAEAPQPIARFPWDLKGETSGSAPG